LIGIGLEVFTVITYVYVFAVYVMVFARLRQKIKMKKHSLGSQSLGGFIDIPPLASFLDYKKTQVAPQTEVTEVNEVKE
jgi:glycopeptide antibiotics resistance protein